MEYTKHAQFRMALRSITEAEVEAVVANPVRGVNRPQARDAVEHFGFCADGRRVNVVTNRARTIVITVVPE